VINSIIYTELYGLYITKGRLHNRPYLCGRLHIVWRRHCDYI